MDFELRDDHVEVRDLAGRIFADLGTVDRVARVEREDAGFDRKLWATLADAGLIGIAVPESCGGAGLGILGLVATLEQQGKRVAPVPVWQAVAGAGLPIAEFGSPEQAGTWLPGLLDGTRPVVGAFEAPPGQKSALHGAGSGPQHTVSGEIRQVPGAGVASALVVPVQFEDGSVRVAVVPTDRAGVVLTPVEVTSRENCAAVRFDGVAITGDDLLPGDGAAIVGWTRRRIRVALAALQLGVSAEALRQTATYTSQRVQFGRPLSTNQAVALRAADAYLDVEALRLTTSKAAWLLDTGDEDAAEAASMVAKWWASDGGLRVVHTGQHLHGGMGADVDYPIHRYFVWGRQIAFSFGSAGAIAAELGDALETAPPIGAPA